MISLEYLAGFFDGEGSIYFYKREREGRSITYQLNVEINQVENRYTGDIMRYIAGEYKGKLRWKDNGPGRTIMNIRWQERIACDFLTILHPHLRIKQRQAELALASKNTNLPHARGMHTMTEVEIGRILQFKEQCYQEIKMLNGARSVEKHDPIVEEIIAELG